MSDNGTEQVRIISDGHPMGTRVERMDGTSIPMVRSIDWHARLDEPFTADIEVIVDHVNIEAGAQLWTMHGGKRYRLVPEDDGDGN